MKNILAHGVVCRYPGAIYMYVNFFFSNIFCETTWPIKAKFHVELPWEGGKKAYINGPGHMTKMTVMPIYGKNLQKSSPTELIVL